MNGKYLMVPALLGLMLFNSPGLMAGPAIQEMVGIVLNLHHHPSDSEKDSLQKIANDGSASQDDRTIATALLNMNHRVTDADREKLNQIANDSTAPEADRKVAAILAGINHTPSDSDKEELKKLQN